MDKYNEQRRTWSNSIQAHGGLRINGGRKWYCGTNMPNDQPEEYDEDCSFSIKDLSQQSPRSPHDEKFSYCMADIDFFTAPRGIPWELSKDIPFSPNPPFTGFIWNLDSRTVEIPLSKKEKYLAAIATWESCPRHTLVEAQQLHGKLLHAALVVPAGRAYLTELETMLANFNNRPLLPHHPPRNCAADLRWWSSTLQQPTIKRHIPGPCEVFDPNAFSDASSGMGVAIWINGWWRAWRLIPGWRTLDNLPRDIGWAEAVGFELLVSAVTKLPHPEPISCVKVYGDNQGVVEGWWKGCSRNRATNNVFKRVHDISVSENCTFLTRYVPSALNPADKPSRGIYPPRTLLLPPIPIHPSLRNLIVDFDAPLHANESPQLSLPPVEVLATTKVRPQWDHAKRSLSNRQLERQGEELLKASQAYC